jgi:MFS family permease
MTANLRLFYLFRLLATSYLYVPIFMLFQAARGLSFSQALALGGLYSAVVIVVEVPTGVFADRLGRRRSMMLGAAMMVVSCLVAVSARGVARFAIAEILGAVSMALCSGADSAYLFDFLLAHDRVHEYGRRESVASAWHLLGSALAFAGGGLLAEVDLALPYLATAGVSAVAVVVAALLRDDRPGLTPAGARPPARLVLRSWTHQVGGALAEVGRNRRLAWMVGYSAVVFVLLRATVYVYQPYLGARGLGPSEIGLLFAGAYVVASLVAFRTHALRRRVGDDALLWLLLGGLAASFVGLSGAASGPWMLALILVQAVANGLYSPLTKPLLNREIHDSSQRAALLSVESMARRAAMTVFSPLVGVCGQGNVMLLCGLCGLGGLLVLATARGRRAAPPVPAGGLADPR